MDLARTVRLGSLPAPLLNHLDARDAAIWVLEPFVAEAGGVAVADLMRLPWRLVLSESSDQALLAALERPEDAADPLVRRRGFVHLVDTNPADVLLPPRCLPVYLLNGRGVGTPAGGLAAMTRRLTMLDALRRIQVKELLIVAGPGAALPPELSQLWQDGLRTIVTVVSDAPEVAAEVEAWRIARPSGTTAAYLPVAAAAFCQELLTRYLSGQAGDRVALRIRNVRGESQSLDITGFDDPEHPLLANYQLLQDGDLRHLQPDDLNVEETQGFFRDATTSWRPYAAGMPWQRDEKAWQKLRAMLGRLDRDGPEAGRVAYISAESGAGGTTVMRQLAWTAAEEGYPTLVAEAAPFTPKALEISTFMTRIIEAQRVAQPEAEKERRYEAPWLLVFDRMHWEGRADELRQFLRELERSGRAACVLVVTGPYIGLNFLDNPYFVQLANLSHEVPLADTVALGRHLNRFIASHGPIRTESEWRGFYEATAVQAERGIAAFWIALSFWLQRQFDMKETVQAWIYRQFKEKVQDSEVRRAILDIAALSTERRPLPEAMLPPTTDWPVSQKIEDIRRDVPALGLARISREGDRYWALAHDVIGRYLLTALFYDPPAREAAGFADALNPEHLRFLALRRLSSLPALGHTTNRAIAEEFAISIFKIDPDHGHANFIQFWREALKALDEMPKPLHATSRAFRHHSAISRRRISKQNDLFPMDPAERVELLERAVKDIRYALENIPVTPDGETDLNLYNSLAHAYQDLAEEEIARGAGSERVAELRALAHDATQRAYRANPDNSFVIETYARSLISDARAFPEKAAENAVEVLNIVYAAMVRDRSGQRRFNLGKLADTAMNLLLETASKESVAREPTDEIEALVQAIQALATGAKRSEAMVLADYPSANRLRAAELLAIPLLQGNPQAVRLRYALRCVDGPRDFRGQLELLQSLQGGGTVFSPQMRLELALLLQQCDRHHEAERLFRELRRLWREGQHYVEVPERLRWLMTIDGQTRRQVTAKIMPRSEHRQAAKVREMQDIEVLFRPQEFGQEQFGPGANIRGFISFGHNGPFLRPTTAIQN